MIMTVLTKQQAQNSRERIERLMLRISDRYAGRPAQKPFLATIIQDCYRTWIDLKAIEAPSKAIVWDEVMEIKMIQNPGSIKQLLKEMADNDTHKITA